VTAFVGHRSFGASGAPTRTGRGRARPRGGALAPARFGAVAHGPAFGLWNPVTQVEDIAPAGRANAP
jgi:hypothetical protein